MMEKLKKNVKWIVFGTLIIAIIVILCGILKYKVLPIDEWAIENIVKGGRTEVLTVLFKGITFFGEAKLLIPIGVLGSIVGFFFFKDRKRTVCFAGNLILIAALNWIIKHVVQRPRPDESLWLVKEDSYSYPSGHAMVTTAFYGLIIYFIYKNVENKLLRNIICIVLSLLIILIDFSRVYLGVHYVTDVLSGSLISIAYLIVAVTFAEKFMFKESKH